MAKLIRDPATWESEWDAVPTPADVEAAMHAADVDDTENRHGTGDDVLCSTLRKLGYGDAVAVFESWDKWYA